MTGEQIINNFRTKVDDSSELSQSQELELLNEIYDEVLSSRKWDFLKTKSTGTLSGNKIQLPVDFNGFVGNFKKQRNAGYTVAVWISETSGARGVAYPIVSKQNFPQDEDRRLAFVENGEIVLSRSFSGTFEFDYSLKWPQLALDTEPLFASQFHKILAFGMARDFYDIDQFGSTNRNQSNFYERKFDGQMEQLTNNTDSEITTYGI